ncbi:MAG: 5-bromo-4-chloroindolyl phosphate hydrolysis family protein [Eubacteriales bacterium]
MQFKIFALILSALFFGLAAITTAGIYVLIKRLLKIKKYRFALSGDSEVDRQIKNARDDIKIIESAAKSIRTINKTLADDIGQLIAGGCNILAYISKNPDRAPLARNFLGYYLPTIKKLLISYIEFRTHNVAPETTAEIEKLIPSMKEVFEKQIEKLVMDRELDISTDIAVLESKIAGDELQINRK